MKKAFHFFLPLACVLLGHISSAQARTVRVFVIGNSFSQNATRYLPELAKEGGHELVIGRAELGGHSLKQHWSYVEAAEANPADSKGKAYSGKSLRELISAGTWDIVTIQQASIHSSDVETYRPYAQKLRNYIKKQQPWAEVVLHQTWAYRSDAKKFGFLSEKTTERTQNQRDMWAKLHGAYDTIAREIGVRVIPVGDAFWRVSSDPKWGYKKDPNFNFEKPIHPALPDQSYSLHAGYRWGSPTNFAFDANHANSAGCYLAGLVWYRFLFNESPAKLTFVPNDVNLDFAAYLRGI